MARCAGNGVVTILGLPTVIYYILLKHSFICLGGCTLRVKHPLFPKNTTKLPWSSSTPTSRSDRGPSETLIIRPPHFLLTTNNSIFLSEEMRYLKVRLRPQVFYERIVY